ncbi:MAG: glutathione synthase [Pseudomonadota bacterium]|nr:glutathione synthase [Pseudomonadota bacterium]
MNLLFIADPLATFKTYKDSTYAMMVEAARRGHGLCAMLAGDLAWSGGKTSGKVVGRMQAIMLTGSDPWFGAGESEWRDLASFDAVIMRTDPPFDQAYLYATWLLEMAERQGARVFNRPQALRDYNEKLAIARFPQFIAPTLVSGDAALIRAFLAEQGDIVVKPLNAMGGSGIFRLRPDDPNLGAILETVTRNGAETIMAQRYLPEIKNGDKRILVIDGEAVPYCLARIPAEGETRGNLAAGGTGVARPLTERDWGIARALGPHLQAAGLLLVGLDVIGDCLTEVNVTSPTCFQEITQQTGFDVAAMFLDALESRVRGLA